MKKTVLVVAAHADDEALGCGGTMARHAASGDAVHALFVADGESARGGTAALTARKNAAAAAAKALGAKAPVHLDLPDNRLDTLALLDVVQAIETVMFKVKPQIIYTHHGGDLNVDHNIVHRAVMTACRPLPGSGMEAVYGFEVLSSTEWASVDQDAPFRPVHYVDISRSFAKKQKALACYKTEMRPFPHPRSPEAVEALAVLRGSQAGLKKAEAFSVLRQFWR